MGHPMHPPPEPTSGRRARTEPGQERGKEEQRRALQRPTLMPGERMSVDGFLR